MIQNVSETISKEVNTLKREQLIKERTSKGLTQQELANTLEIATITVRKIESGERNPSHSMAKKFAIYYKRDLDILFPDLFLIKFDTKRNITN